MGVDVGGGVDVDVDVEMQRNCRDGVVMRLGRWAEPETDDLLKA